MHRETINPGLINNSAPDSRLPVRHFSYWPVNCCNYLCNNIDVTERDGIIKIVLNLYKLNLIFNQHNINDMKSFSIIPVFFIYLFCIAAAVQEPAKIPSGISLAFKTGNAADLSKFMNSTIELLLLNKEDFYKKNAAETILKDFFAEYQAKDFTIRHQGAKNDAQYAIGNLTTSKGDFRVYFLLKKVDQDILIHQIRIESDNEK